MSVIANVLCTPNRVEILVRAVAAEPSGISQEELLSRLSPAVLRDDEGEDGGSGVMAKRVLQEAESLELVDLKSNRLFLRDPALADPNRLRDWLHDHLLPIATADAIGQRAFPRALAWFLMQDPLQPVPANSADPSETARALIEATFGSDADLFELGSQAPFMQFGYWARYLGYATHVRVSRGRTAYAPDPTDALSRLVSAQFRAGQELLIREFVDRLAASSPVLDGGSSRVAIEQAMSSRARTDRSTDVSRSLSYALLCLDDIGSIRLQSRADAPQLAVVVGDTRRSYTHVTIGGRHA